MASRPFSSIKLELTDQQYLMRLDTKFCQVLTLALVRFSCSVKFQLFYHSILAVFKAAGPVQGPTPLSVEPCSNYKSGIFTLAVRLPTGGRTTTPNGTSGLAVASALCLLTSAQLGVLQAPPDNSESRNNRKTTLFRYIPFLRTRGNHST
ncbi:unnamed protein product [Angiostrongylus costaricensis]|uniref:Uncharacterized protein n=1 Tax=Angiostrongylus costaricensis TaxID=334426 RepID=A0A0R3PWG2_ANGCS|nr:unnamed protein product [Angiostrongylus costaricensis]